MIDYSLFELRKINEAYESMVSEATARPNSYKNLTPEQAEEFAKLSPSYKSPQIWGNTSNWICSAANKMIKFRNLSPDVVYEYAKEMKNDIADFEKFQKKLKRDIGTIPTFDDLRKFMAEARESGSTTEGLSKEAREDGRARQCYSLMKNGGDNFVQTYEDGNYVIGYPTNFDYNSKFSSIGKWCHTGSFGNGEQYWGNYGQYPVFYILNKHDGTVLCASYQDGYGEVRDQHDNYPNGFTGKNWDDFFTVIGLKGAMIDGVKEVCRNYVVPDDAVRDVWERVDSDLVCEQLFNGMYAELEGDDYGRGTGNFYLSVRFDAIDPNNTSEDDVLVTRYDANVDENEYYTFEEFKTLCYESWKTNSTVNHNELIEKIIVNSNYFQSLWNNERDMVYYSWTGNRDFQDEYTMAERFSSNQLLEILSGKTVDFGFDSSRKQQDIRDAFAPLVKEYCQKFLQIKRDAVPSEKGSVDFWSDNVSLSIDADEADHLARSIQNGEITFEKGPDLIACNLGGKNHFAAKRINIEKDMRVGINNAICHFKYICKNVKDLDGQMTFDLKMPDGRTYYGG